MSFQTPRALDPISEFLVPELSTPSRSPGPWSSRHHLGALDPRSLDPISALLTLELSTPSWSLRPVALDPMSELLTLELSTPSREKGSGSDGDGGGMF